MKLRTPSCMSHPSAQSTFWGVAIHAISLSLLSVPTLAQTVPDAGSLLRENQRSPAPQHHAPAPQIAPSSAVTTHKDDGLHFSVKAFKLVGATLVPEAELQAVLAPWLNQTIGFSDLEAAGAALSEAYSRRGLLMRTQLPTQDINDGIVTFKIIEGRLGAVQIDDGGQALRLKRELVLGMLTARQQPGQVLRLDALERATNLLNDTPGVLASVALTSGKAEGESDVVVKLQDRPLLAGLVQLDNQGSRSTGTARLSGSVALDNPAGRGDQAALSSNVSEGTAYARLAYTTPVGWDGLRVGVYTSAMRYKLLNEFAALNAKGDAQTLGVSGSYPIVRSRNNNVSATAVLETKRYRNEANGAETSRKTSTTVLLGLTGDSTDASDDGGFTLWGVNATLGRLDLAANAVNQTADQAGPQTQGSFGKLGFNLGRFQRVANETSLWLSASGQVAGKNLDSSEKFSLGGPNGVRAYPSLEAQGDSGLMGNLELRHNLRTNVQAIGFYDAGRVQVNHSANYAGAAALNSITLKGYGLGMRWTDPGNFALSATAAKRLGQNPLASPTTGKDSDGSKDAVRFWISGVKYF